MLDTVGPELQVVNKSGNPISLLADGFVILTSDQEQEASSEVLPINFDGLSKVCYIFVFTFLFWLGYCWCNDCSVPIVDGTVIGSGY